MGIFRGTSGNDSIGYARMYNVDGHQIGWGSPGNGASSL